MKNIHILPTDKPSRLYQLKNDILRLDYKIDKGEANKHIYITSDEEIKEGDWFLQTTYEGIFKCSDSKIEYIYFDGDSYEPVAYCKKIILSTDQDLIKDGVQAIGEEFLEWFVKNPSCEKVEVESKVTKDGVWTDLKGYVELPTIHSISYKIIIPKEEPKQETLEEAELRQLFRNRSNCYADADDVVQAMDENCFIETINEWQQERMYSEEEVEDFIYKVCGTVARLQGITLNGNHIDTAYKQFKKK